eukprot:CAMPEP_0170104466 /NCGR_PEP_ID=MMETSP0020_2-20130122/4151_1 /TAXON_ID=98059 /ORGANISM="Dinobryon sp., Strain UTEXLB2267" /LENGTH=328 /DNA_ID=CAMNT_0010328319 /DNA_START=676 /DNA_END=1659 /DNA_ORIENTATION=+
MMPTTATNKNRLWIYMELFKDSICSYASGEFAFGVSSGSCISQSPFFDTLFLGLNVKSFKILGNDCKSTHLRLYDDFLCSSTKSFPAAVEFDIWNQIKSFIGSCLLPPENLNIKYHAKMICTNVHDHKLPTLNINSFVASGYSDFVGMDMVENCLDVTPATFAAIPSDQCVSHIPSFLVPIFAPLLSPETSSYQFMCDNADLGYALELEYLGNNVCKNVDYEYNVPLDLCEIRKISRDGVAEDMNNEQFMIRSHIHHDRRLFNHLTDQTIDPSQDPTINPSQAPTIDPSHVPTFNPSHVPTFNPSNAPIFNPSHVPTVRPSQQPTDPS